MAKQTDNKKVPKEASALFHNIMKASVKDSPKDVVAKPTMSNKMKALRLMDLKSIKKLAEKKGQELPEHLKKLK